MVQAGLTLVVVGGVSLWCYVKAAEASSFYRRMLPWMRPILLALIALGALLLVVGALT